MTTKMTVLWTASWMASSPTSAVSSCMSAIRARSAGEGETRSSRSSRWLRSIMAAWVRRALRHTVMRSASPATAITMKAAPNSWLMLGARNSRHDRAHRPGSAGGEFVMRGL